MFVGGVSWHGSGNVSVVMLFVPLRSCKVVLASSGLSSSPYLSTSTCSVSMSLLSIAAFMKLLVASPIASLVLLVLVLIFVGGAPQKVPACSLCRDGGIPS